MHSKFKRRDKLTEQYVISFSPSMKRELFEAAASRNMTVADFTRNAIKACIAAA